MEWAELEPSADLDSFAASRTELHHAILLIASAGEALADPVADDSHRGMVWNLDVASFDGNLLPGSPAFCVRLHPEALNVALVDASGRTFLEGSIEGKTLDEALEWLRAAMPIDQGRRNFNVSAFDATLPDPQFRTKRFGETGRADRAALVSQFANTQIILDYLVSDHPGASPIRCWPHHFDLATLLPGPTKDSTIGVGYSPGDGQIPEPYWYVSPSPHPTLGPAPTLPSPAIWHTEGWTGAAIRVRDFVNSTAAESQAQKLKDLVEECIAVAGNQISEA